MSFSSSSFGKEFQERLRRVLDALDVPVRATLALYYAAGLSEAEIDKIQSAGTQMAPLRQSQAELEKQMELPVGSLRDQRVEDEIRQAWPDRMTEQEIEDAQTISWRRLQAKMAKHDLEFKSLYHEGNPEALRDLQVLAAIHLLGGESSFKRILAIVSGWLGRDDKPKFIYAILDRLESAGAITSRFADSSDSGANAERLFTLTSAGERKVATANEQALARVKGEPWDESNPAAWGLPADPSS